jgi:prepilin-type N-terminal cleavage/methylation domain-containing protein/prepilin-type processing-associated H-X9-DG protein
MNTLSHLRGAARRGFTLIELLTVIAIIGILAAIIIPTVGKVRLQAKNATCVSNLRQLATALILSADERRGQLPWATASGANESWTQTTTRLLSSTAANRSNIFRCPVPTPAVAATNGVTYYGVNQVLMPDGTSTTSVPVKLNNITRPSEVVLLGDACLNPADGNAQSLFAYNVFVVKTATNADNASIIGVTTDSLGRLAYVHGDTFASGRANVAMADGSVKSFVNGTIKPRNFSISY